MTLFNKVQFLSNVVFIITAPTLIVIVLGHILFPANEPKSLEIPKPPANMLPARPSKAIEVIGQTVPLDSVDWKGNKKTLVLYLSKNCRYCQESTPFYRRLLKETGKDGTDTIAVLSQEVDEAKAYLKSENLSIKKIYRSSFASIGVTATPTLLLVDGDGRVVEYWRGKLSPEKEADVIAKVSSRS